MEQVKYCIKQLCRSSDKLLLRPNTLVKLRRGHRTFEGPVQDQAKCQGNRHYSNMFHSVSHYRTPKLTRCTVKIGAVLVDYPTRSTGSRTAISATEVSRRNELIYEWLHGENTGAKCSRGQEAIPNTNPWRTSSVPRSRPIIYFYIVAHKFKKMALMHVVLPESQLSAEKVV